MVPPRPETCAVHDVLTETLKRLETKMDKIGERLAEGDMSLQSLSNGRKADEKRITRLEKAALTVLVLCALMVGTAMVDRVILHRQRTNGINELTQKVMALSQLLEEPRTP